jgi:hypothetical protein
LSEQVLHSVNAAGRHWLTVASQPPLQIGPVAPNHCRIGYHLLQALVHALDELPRGEPVPDTLDIHLETGSAAVRVALPMLPGPEDWGSPDAVDEVEDEDEPVLFLTLVAPGCAPQDIDEWIVPLANALGLEAEPAIAEGGYERAMQAAQARTQAALGGVRERFMNRGLLNFGGPRFGFKIGLATSDGGTEWVWVQPKDWKSAERLKVKLESAPVSVPGRRQGDSFEIAAADIADYVIYDPKSGESEGGFTQRIAADYGLILPN